jgi:hypothetical protein
MQRNGSFLLSYTVLRYYQRTDIKIYNELRRKHLSSNWQNSDNETKIKEMAHNIRNKFSNFKIKRNRLYNDDQMQLIFAR